MKIGWIGLGSIGNVMAYNLIKEGYHLIVHDLDYKTAEKLIASGAEWAETPQALACKDLRLTMKHARKYAVPLELGALVEQIFMRAKNQYGEDAHSTQAVKLLEDSMNVYLRACGYEDFR